MTDKTGGATFKWWQWWSDWQDIGTFNYGDGGYLLQGRRSRVNQAGFRCVAMKSLTNIAHAPASVYNAMLAAREAK